MFIFLVFFISFLNLVLKFQLPSGFDSFKFSNPIEHELPSNKSPPEDKAPVSKSVILFICYL